MAKIFISYRREDSQWQTKSIYDALSNHVDNPKTDIFYDLDSMTVGLDFKKQIELSVEKCDVLLAMIGINWLNAVDPDTGIRRLDYPRDFVRAEIAAALKRNIPVVPVLLDGVDVPEAEDLPEDIQQLAMRHGVKIRADSFKHDVNVLIQGLNLSKKATSEKTPISDGSEIATAADAVKFDPDRYVFISHPNSVDPEIIRTLARGLIDAGMPVWIFNPSDMGFEAEELVSMNWQKPGGNHYEQALEAVRQSSCVVMLTGRTTGAGGFQTKELETAIASNKEIVAAIVDDLPFNELPKGLEDRFVPPIDAELLRSGRQLPMLVSDILNAADRPSKRRRKFGIKQWAGLTAAAGLLAVGGVIAWLSGALEPTPTPKPTRTTEEYLVGSTFTDCTGCPEMVVLPSGSFRMGSPSSEPKRDDYEGPQRTVRIGYKLAVGKYEVTWSQWEACVSAGACSNSGPDSEGGDEDWGKGSRPVINVSWNDAQAYVKWLSWKTGHTYRLLSEAEWEYAARAGTTTPFSFGSTISTRQANYDGNYTYNGGSKGEYRKKTVAVGSFSANAWGLHDMHGNVWEWVEDWYKEGYSHAPSDGRPFTNCSNCSYRVSRGGSWGTVPGSLRSANRGGNSPSVRYSDLGFRVARTL